MCVCRPTFKGKQVEKTKFLDSLPLNTYLLYHTLWISLFRAYQFKLEEVEGFRYRSKDAWRAVTRIAVREARLKEIKQEVLNCEKLKVCFFWMNSVLFNMS